MNFRISERHRHVAVRTWYAGDGVPDIGECEADRRYISGQGPWSNTRAVNCLLDAIAQLAANQEGEERVCRVRAAGQSGVRPDVLAAIAGLPENVVARFIVDVSADFDDADARYLVERGWQ